MKNWYKILISQYRGPKKALFKKGQEVSVNSSEIGMTTGFIESIQEFRDGEWYYKVMIDDLMDSIVIPESNLISI